MKKNETEIDQLIKKPNMTSENIKISSSAETSEVLFDIINRSHGDVKELAEYFRNKELKEIHRFIRSNFKWELKEMEAVRTPSRAWADRHKPVDAADQTIFISCILKCLDIKHKLVFASFGSREQPSHVYIIAEIDYKVFIVDACMMEFNKEAPGITHKSYLEIC